MESTSYLLSFRMVLSYLWIFYINLCVNRVLPREVAQAVKGSNDTRFYGGGSGDVGKELPRNRSFVYTCMCVLRADMPEAPRETFPGCIFVPGIP